MRLGLMILIMVLCSCGASDQSRPPASRSPQVEQVRRPLAANSSVDEILAALDQCGARAHDFTAEVASYDTDPASGDTTVYRATMWYQSGGGGDIRMRFSGFSGVEAKRDSNRIEYLIEGGWMIERNFEKRIQTEYQIQRPSQHMNPFKLGEGPFPMLIGQHPSEVYRQFNVVKKFGEGEFIRLSLIPRPGTYFEKGYSSIEVWVETSSSFPIKVVLNSKDGAIRKAEWSNVHTNVGLTDADFKLEPVSNWTKKTQAIESQ